MSFKDDGDSSSTHDHKTQSSFVESSSSLLSSLTTPPPQQPQQVVVLSGYQLQRMYERILDQNPPHPKYINLSHTCMNDEDTCHIVQALLHHRTDSHVRMLKLCYNQISVKGCQALTTLILTLTQQNTSSIHLEGLHLTDNPFLGDEGVMALSVVFSSSVAPAPAAVTPSPLLPPYHPSVPPHTTTTTTTPTTADAADTSTTTTTMTPPSSTTPTTKKSPCQSSPPSPSSSSSSSWLRSFKLNQCHISNKGVQILAFHLHHNPTLEYLYLGVNHIGDNGALALATMLQVNTKLKMLSLYQNNIGDKGVIALASSLEHPHTNKNKNNTTLKMLVLHHNPTISDRGACALGHMLQANSTLKELIVHSNPRIGYKGMKALVEGAKYNFSLMTLEVVLIPPPQPKKDTDQEDQQDSTHDTTAAFLKLQEEINYYMFLNDVGHRRILRDDGIPLGLWSILLAKFANHPTLPFHQTVGILYHYLQSKPELYHCHSTIHNPSS